METSKHETTKKEVPMMPLSKRNISNTSQGQALSQGLKEIKRDIATSNLSVKIPADLHAQFKGVLGYERLYMQDVIAELIEGWIKSKKK